MISALEMSQRITNAATPPLAYMDGSFQVIRPEGAS